MSILSVIPSRKAIHGKGRAELHVFGDNAHFAELSYTYPLKLLSPRATTAGENEAAERVAILYSLTYGGGLIGGDRVELSLDLKDRAKLVLLTQGSTKVFPSRPSQRLSSGNSGVGSLDSGVQHTLQRMSARVAPSAFLVLLPDPVTPFQGASYSQTQIFRLAPATKTTGMLLEIQSPLGGDFDHALAGGSLLLLDWFTSGRIARGEEWQFDRYRSVNEVWIGEKQVACDVLLLDQQDQSGSRSPVDGGVRQRYLQTSLAPYSCYATVLMFGAATQSVSGTLRSRYDSLSQMQRKMPESLIWSFSPLENGEGSVVRVAATETEVVRSWLREALRGLESHIGVDTYSKAFV